jgi:hypothetical protein
MAKRGRKSKAEKEEQQRKGYFYETEEEAFVNYITTDDENEKNKIFNLYLFPAFTKMIESIIRRYKLYPPDEEYQETFDDTISFMITKLNRFDPSMGYKAYSYCGTVCKNYLILKMNQFNKNQKRNSSYDNMFNELNDSIKFSYDQHSSKIAFLTELVENTVSEIREMLDNKQKFKLNENEIKVGLALVSLLGNWEELFAQMGSNKFNKSSILLFLKETTLLSTKEIRDGMKKYKNVYYLIKKKIIDEES